MAFSSYEAYQNADPRLVELARGGGQQPQTRPAQPTMMQTAAPQRPDYATAMKNVLGGFTNPQGQLDQNAFSQAQAAAAARGNRMTPEEYYGAGGNLENYSKLYGGLYQPGFEQAQSDTQAAGTRISPELYFRLGGNVGDYHKLYGDPAPSSPGTQSQATVQQSQQMNDLMGQSMNQAYQSLQQPLPEMPQLPGYTQLSGDMTDLNANRQRVEDSIFGQFQGDITRDYDRERDMLQQEMANRGLSMGNEQYTRAFDDLTRRKDEAIGRARTAAIGEGRNEFTTQLGAQIDLGNYGIGLGDYGLRGVDSSLRIRQAPLSELGSIYGLGANQQQIALANKELENAIKQGDFQRAHELLILQKQQDFQREQKKGGGGGGGGGSGGGNWWDSLG